MWNGLTLSVQWWREKEGEPQVELVAAFTIHNSKTINNAHWHRVLECRVARVTHKILHSFALGSRVNHLLTKSRPMCLISLCKWHLVCKSTLNRIIWPVKGKRILFPPLEWSSGRKNNQWKDFTFFSLPFSHLWLCWWLEEALELAKLEEFSQRKLLRFERRMRWANRPQL